MTFNRLSSFLSLEIFCLLSRCLCAACAWNRCSALKFLWFLSQISFSFSMLPGFRTLSIALCIAMLFLSFRSVCLFFQTFFLVFFWFFFGFFWLFFGFFLVFFWLFFGLNSKLIISPASHKRQIEIPSTNPPLA